MQQLARFIARPVVRRWSFFIFFALLPIGVSSFSTTSFAEPWLSTRYAQNCAGCHAPGRKNLPAMDRRCTLSCQGCHVNPNGGGLRSTYGKWNEDRWLRSFRADVLKNPRTVAPSNKQHYDNEEKIKKSKKPFKKTKKIRNGAKKGLSVVEVDNVGVPEGLYGRDGLEFINADKTEFLYQVPQGDPYRQLEQSKVDGGADIRNQFTQYSINGEDPEWHRFLMSVDFAIRWRPVYRNVHLVYESRMLGSPSPNATYEKMLSSSYTRSLYLMIDNLPYNVFIMGGYYRPLFGNYIPDHYAIAQEMTSYAMTGNSKNYGILYNAVSIGTAPNVPYLNVHLIQKAVGDEKDKTKGFALNTGLRFVTLGASLNYSYWRTKDERPDRIASVEMHSIGAAAKFFRTVTSLEAVSLARDVDTEDFRQGGVWMLDTYTQLWRENYFTLAYSIANTTRELKPGKTNQMKSGIKSFLLPGVEVNLVYETRDEVADKEGAAAETTKLKGYSGQLHVYF